MIKQKGSTYINVLIYLVVIEFVGLTLLSAVTVANQANLVTQRTTVAYRIGESYMEQEIQQIEQEFLTTPNSPIDSFCHVTNPTVPKWKEENGNYTVYVNRIQKSEELCLIRVSVDYKIKQLNGKEVYYYASQPQTDPNKKGGVILESLVGQQ